MSTLAKVDTLTPAEVSRLAACEQVIERGLKTFFEVGEALAEVRDARLYLVKGHKTFEDYCQKRWGFSGRRGRQLTDAAAVVKALPLGTIVPNEAQAREVAKLPEAERVPAIEAAAAKAEAEKRTLTARDIREAGGLSPMGDKSRVSKPRPGGFATGDHARTLGAPRHGVNPSGIFDRR